MLKHTMLHCMCYLLNGKCLHNLALEPICARLSRDKSETICPGTVWGATSNHYLFAEVALLLELPALNSVPVPPALSTGSQGMGSRSQLSIAHSYKVPIGRELGMVTHFLDCFSLEFSFSLGSLLPRSELLLLCKSYLTS